MSPTQKRTITANDFLEQIKNQPPNEEGVYSLNYNPSETLGKGGGGDPNDCDCSYRITNLELAQPSSASTGYGYELAYTGGNCSDGCELFWYNWNSDVACNSTSNCVYIPPSGTPDPYGLIPFHCTVPRYSGNMLFFGSYDYENSPCEKSPLDGISTITFVVFCSEKTPDPSCKDGKGYGFSSGPITIDVASGSTIEAIFLEMGGECGCTPIPL